MRPNSSTVDSAVRCPIWTAPDPILIVVVVIFLFLGSIRSVLIPVVAIPISLVGAVFLGLGWVAALALPGLWIQAGVAPAALVLAGGLLYTAGAVCYRRHRPDPRPSVFGYHEVFHACVCAAATCQYVSITLITARIGR